MIKGVYALYEAFRPDLQRMYSLRCDFFAIIERIDDERPGRNLSA